MTGTISLPCVRCGRPVTVPVERASDAGALRCDRCSAGGDAFDVEARGAVTRLDRATLVARLRAGTLRPEDTVSEAGGPRSAIGAHPALRTLFLPGHPDFLGLDAAPAAKPGGWLARLLGRRGGGTPGPTEPDPAPPAAVRAAPAAPRAAPRAPAKARSGGGGVVALLILAGGVGALVAIPESREALLAALPLGEPIGGAPVAPAAPVAAGSAATTASPPARAPVAPAASADPAGATAFAALLARVGTVDEPRNLLLSRAWTAYDRGDPASVADALASAERAVARQPADPESLALLAELLAVRDEAPDLRDELIRKASAVAPSHPTVMSAAAACNWRDHLGDAAHAVASRCVTASPDALGCADWKVRTAPATVGPAERLAAWDALAATHRENRRIVRTAALFAAESGTQDAEQRLVAVRGKGRGDAEVIGALARVKHAKGDDAGAAALLRGLGKDAPADAVVAVAGAALSRGEAGAASSILAILGSAPIADPKVAVRASVLRAQVAVYALRESPTDAAARARVDAAADAVLAASPGEPAAVQAKLLAGALAGAPAAGVGTAWDQIPTGSTRGRDRARLWLARAWADLARGAARDAASALVEAQQADPHLPELYLWRARVALAGQDAPAAFAALREAIRDVDGTDERRRPVGVTLPVPCDPATLARDLDALVGGNAAQKADLDASIAVLAWLGGETSAALGTATVLADTAQAPDLYALVARLRLAQGDAAGALVAADRAVKGAPATAAWQLLRARTLAALGRHAEVLPALSVVKGAGAPSSFVLTLEAEARAGTRDLSGAVEAARAAVAADPEDEAAAALVARLAGAPLAPAASPTPSRTPAARP